MRENILAVAVIYCRRLEDDFARCVYTQILSPPITTVIPGTRFTLSLPRSRCIAAWHNKDIYGRSNGDILALIDVASSCDEMAIFIARSHWGRIIRAGTHASHCLGLAKEMANTRAIYSDYYWEFADRFKWFTPPLAYAARIQVNGGINMPIARRHDARTNARHFRAKVRPNDYRAEISLSFGNFPTL